MNTGDYNVFVTWNVTNVTTVSDRAARLRDRRISSPLPLKPPGYQERPDAIGAIRDLLLNRDVDAVGITGLHGMGGIGKTVLATALARDPAVEASFPAGIVWLTFGRDAITSVKQDQLAYEMSGVRRPSRDIHEAKSVVHDLAMQLTEPLLVVLDDVCNPEGVRTAFAGLGGNVRLLVTTRDRRVLTALDARECEIALLTEDEALELLSATAGLARGTLPKESGEVVKRCGRLPLALTAVGVLVRDGAFEWTEVLEALQKARQEDLPTSWLGESGKTDLAAVLSLSIKALSLEAQSCLRDFAVLREDVPVPEDALVRLWSASRLPLRARAIARDLASRSILQRDAHERYSIHDLYREFLADTSGALIDLHRGVVERYVIDSEGVWARGRDDGYYFENLPWHLSKGDRDEDVASLLLDPAWLARKISASGVGDTIADFSLIANDELQRIAAALRLSASELTRAPTSVSSQICGRLTATAGPFSTRILTAARDQLPATAMIPIADGHLDRPGHLLRKFEGHEGFVNALAVAPDGRMAASASENGTVMLWSVETGLLMETFAAEPHGTDYPSGANAVVIMAHARRLVAGFDDGTLGIWNLDDSSLVELLQSPVAPIDLLAELPDGWRVVSASSKGGIQLWDIPARRLLGRFAASGIAVTSVCALSDGLVLVGDANGGVRLWDPLDGRLIRSFEGLTGKVMTIMANDDRTIVFAATDAGTALAWSIEAPDPIRRLEGLPIDSKGVAPIPGRNWIASATIDGRLHVWDAGDGREHMATMAHGDFVHAVAPLPDGVHLLSGAFDGTIHLWDLLAPPASELLHACESGIYAVALAADGRHAISGSEDGHVRVWDMHLGTVLADLPECQGIVHAVAFLRDDAQAVSGGADGILRIWDLPSKTLRTTLDTGLRLINALAVIDDHHVIVGGGTGSIAVCNIADGTVVTSEERHRTSISSVCLLPDGVHAATGASDGDVRIWHLPTLRTTRILRCGTATVHAATAYGKHGLVTGSANGDLTLWDLKKGEGEGIAWRDAFEPGASPAVLGIAIFPEADRIAVCSGDHRICIQGVRGRSGAKTFADDHLVCAIATNGAGTHLVAGNQTGRMHLFDLS